MQCMDEQHAVYLEGFCQDNDCYANFQSPTGLQYLIHLDCTRQQTPSGAV